MSDAVTARPSAPDHGIPFSHWGVVHIVRRRANHGHFDAIRAPVPAAQLGLVRPENYERNPAKPSSLALRSAGGP